MLSPRRTAHLGLFSAAVVLLASLMVLLNGRESVRSDRGTAKAATSEDGQQIVLAKARVAR